MAGESQDGKDASESWILAPIEALVGERHPLAFVVLIPVFILMVRVVIKWLQWLRSLILSGGGGSSPGLFMPRHVQGTVHPYGVVELKGRRPYMEDRHAVVPELLNNSSVTVYAVFDGHGGDAAAQYCADYLGSVLAESPTNLLLKPTTALAYAFKTIDERFLEVARMRKMDDGTTALAALAIGKQLTIANTGDSRAILVKKNGKTMALSRDHKPDRNDERDRIARLGGSVVHWGVWRVEGVLAVSRAIGDRLLKEYVIPDPEFVQCTITPEDCFLVLATDGLWDVVDNAQVGRLLLGVKDAQEGSEVLTQKAFECGTQDNVTVMVVDLRQAAQKSFGDLQQQQQQQQQQQTSSTNPASIVDGSSGSIRRDKID
jgi:protein phosphatase 1L